MTQRGVLSLTVGREAASVVCDFVAIRTLRNDSQSTIRLIREDARSSAVLRPIHSLVHLPAFSNKLRAAVHRKRRDDGSETITLTNLPREVATAGFYFLAFVLHPDAPAIKDHEASAVREVGIALAMSLTAKPGTRPLSSADAEYVIAEYRQYLDRGQRTWAMKLMERLARVARIEMTSVSRMPAPLLALLT